MNDLAAFGATDGVTDANPTTFIRDRHGILDCCCSTEKPGALWYKGVHDGAEKFMASSHAEDKKSLARTVKMPETEKRDKT